MSIDIKKIYGIHHNMLDKDILLAYKGEFNQQVVNTLLSNTKKQLNNFIEDLQTRRRIYAILVECLDNVKIHAGEGIFNEQDSFPQYPVVVMGKSDTGYYVTAGNFISNEQIDSLKQKLNDINELNREELKEKYRDTLLKGKISKTGGAGIGIIDMAIKSDNKLEYDFVTVKKDISFFILEIKI